MHPKDEETIDSLTQLINESDISEHIKDAFFTLIKILEVSYTRVSSANGHIHRLKEIIDTLETTVKNTEAKNVSLHKMYIFATIVSSLTAFIIGLIL